ncbi:MAG TPA: alpha-L-rhamnosidase C-terminal domain-containing protein [Pseudacidobacterium sp.]|nr:alpha-L-rhamnosidase C-terminal domain-containing protein [Pseudacidobacterium sp.]
MKSKMWIGCGMVAVLSCIAAAQELKPTTIPLDQIDPARKITAPRLQSETHKPLPEEYIWTQEDAISNDALLSYRRPGRNSETAPHYFRRVFTLDRVPPDATLYIAGPRSVEVYVNGQLVGHDEANLDAPIGMQMFTVDVGNALREGQNIIAIEAVRGPGVNGFTNSRFTMQLAAGKAMVVKLVGASRGADTPVLVISNKDWKASLHTAEGWQKADFDDASWKAADSLGPIEGSIDLFQWNADAGMYNWPGYEGISPFLAQAPLEPVSVEHVYGGVGAVHNADALKGTSAGNEFTVDLPSRQVEDTQAPQVLLDFGRDANGRLHFISDSDRPAVVTVQYGESEDEALKQPYLGMNAVYVPAHGSAYGPKSAFRYALLRFVEGGEGLRFKSINLDLIYYPVKYQGFFESSDPKLNLMWTIGAYTAHLCMQDDIWDAPKRDRGRWMGDLDVSGRTINDVFADHFLMEDTLNRLIGPAPVRQHVNGIAGYSAFWITGEAEYYRHFGNKQQLMSFHDRLIQLMHYMEKELDGRNLYVNKTGSWPFVDWSPELNGDTPESRFGTQLEFIAAFDQGVYLLKEMGDTANAEQFTRELDGLKAAAREYLLDRKTNAYSSRWQLNAMAVLSGLAPVSQYADIWNASLSSVGKIKYNAFIITPYYNYYVISAMAKMGHRQEALNWIRQYWGGMVDEGATSFWEGYDPAWYKNDAHGSLQADNMSGYRVSLAHGWSSGVTPWLMEEVLGIHATGPGFSTVDIRPDLIDLDWAKGGEPTPHGMLDVSLKKQGSGTSIAIELPAEVEAHVSVPVSSTGQQVFVNGKAVKSESVEDGARAVVVLREAGHYEIAAK